MHKKKCNQIIYKDTKVGQISIYKISKGTYIRTQSNGFFGGFLRCMEVKMAKAAGLPNVVAAGWGHSVEPIQECHGFPRNPWMKHHILMCFDVLKMDVFC